MKMVAAVETMAYVGSVPWHGLGNRVEENITLDDFQKQAGLDWTVSKRPVWYPKHDDVGLHVVNTFSKRFVIARDTDDRPYSVVSDRYKPVQPKEIFEFFHDLLSMHKMKMHTAGSLKDGARIWCLAETGDSHKVRGVDKVDGYLLLSTSYDLSLSTLAQFTSVRVVCNNTLQQALKNSTGRVTIPHIQDFDPEAIKAELGFGRDQWMAFTGMLDTLAKIDLSVADTSKIVNKIFQIPVEIEKAMHDPNQIHAKNIVDMFDHRLAKGSDIAGNTAWGLLNCVTEYVDFRKRARNQGNRLNSAWFGDGAQVKQNAVNELVLLAA
ncbi:MAG: DUF932 domain-containing protein [Bacteroidia bacterium]|nr:DUF932 domain-containing protein [Bacteroidia bacterium]